jgi:hypothetical protein
MPNLQPQGGALTAGSLAILEAMSSGLLGLPRNLIDGGDFTVNPWQRNIAGLATAGVITTPITNTPKYFPDRFFAVGGGSSAILMAQVADTSLPGFSQACKVSRQAANADLTKIQFGQVIETADTIKLQGLPVTFSFYAKAGANFSSAGLALTAQVVYGTGTNQSAASMAAGTWTGFTNLINQAVVLITGGYQRFSFTATLPSNATQIGIMLSFTPVGTAGADDSFTVQGLQLEQSSFATNFEHRDIEFEIALAQRYCFVIAEPAAGVVVAQGGCNLAANSQVFLIDMPTIMRTAPTVTVSAGTFQVAAGAAAASATGFAAGTTHIASAISLNTTLTQAAGGSAQLQGNGGSGYVLASADF